jgi:deoxyribonuclease-1
MKLSKIFKILPRLRRWSPAGAVIALFFLPFLSVDNNTENTKQTVKSPTSTSQQTTSGSRVNLDPFSQGGAFAITQTDADRATWSWSRAKKLAIDVWEDQNPGEGDFNGFYCGCDISKRGSTGGDVDMTSCGYTPRASSSRASRMEWEHIVPAAFIGQGLSCWSEGAPECVDKTGEAFKGRECCMIADPGFIMAASDPVNLVPAIGEVNGDRLNYFFGEVSGEARSYGQCDMEIDQSSKLAEPPVERRGDIARIWAYMSRAYGLALPADKAALYHQWLLSDPVSEEEIRINQSIARHGHRANPFVLSAQN